MQSGESQRQGPARQRKARGIAFREGLLEETSPELSLGPTGLSGEGKGTPGAGKKRALGSIIGTGVREQGGRGRWRLGR